MIQKRIFIRIPRQLLADVDCELLGLSIGRRVGEFGSDELPFSPLSKGGFQLRRALPSKVGQTGAKRLPLFDDRVRPAPEAIVRLTQMPS